MVQPTFHLVLQHSLAVAAMVLLMTLCGECTEGMPTSAYNHSTLLANLTQEGFEAPRVQRSQRQPCKEEHKGYCIHGDCYIHNPEPDGSQGPSCICSPGAEGDRCERHMLETLGSQTSVEEIIGITLGVALLLGSLAGAIYCCMRKRCRKESLPYQTYDSKEAV